MKKDRIGNFLIKKKIGEGAFGEIYHGCNVKSNSEVAIKVEFARTRHPQLFYEAKLYNYLHNDVIALAKGIPRIYYAGIEEGMNVMVMDLLGPSLEDAFNQCNRRLTVKTVLMIADQMLNIIEYLHSRGIIHRDIKPDNFMMGRGKTEDKLFMIDFGLAKKIISGGKHIGFRDNKSLTGTARYASINNHLGYEQSRRDDMEAIGYVFFYFLKGKLPWQNLPASNKKEKFQRIMEKKISTPVEKLGAGLPKEFEIYLSYCKNLRFDEEPDYKWAKNMFQDLFKRESYKSDNLFDWKLGKVKAPEEKKEEAQPTNKNDSQINNVNASKFQSFRFEPKDYQVCLSLDDSLQGN